MRNSRIALVAIVVVLLVVAQRLGLFAQFADVARARQALLDLGPWGYLAFVAAYATLQPFGVPGTVFILVAPLIWPWPLAFGLSMVGTMAASVAGFSFARFLARDWVAARIPRRLRAYDASLERHAFATVLVLRLVFWMPPWLHAFFGASKVPFWTHFWASAAGYVLPLLATSYFGLAMFDWMRNAPPSAWIGIGAAIGAIALGTWGARRCRRRNGPHRDTRPPSRDALLPEQIRASSDATP